MPNIVPGAAREDIIIDASHYGVAMAATFWRPFWGLGFRDLSGDVDGEFGSKACFIALFDESERTMHARVCISEECAGAQTPD